MYNTIANRALQAGRPDMVISRADLLKHKLGDEIMTHGAKAIKGAAALSVVRVFGTGGSLKYRESLARLVCNIMRLADGAASGDWRLSVV
jgi:hypothetical protein